MRFGSLFAGIGGFDLGLERAGWRCAIADSLRYRTLGNAVTVPVAEWIGRRILRAHQEAPRG